MKITGNYSSSPPYYQQLLTVCSLKEHLPINLWN